MKFRELTLKQLFENPKCVALIKEIAPELLKFPTSMFANRRCGELFDLAIKQRMFPEKKIRALAAAIEAIL